MRIAIDVTRHPSSGIGRYSWDLLENWTRSNQCDKFVALATRELAGRAREFAEEVIIVDDSTQEFDDIVSISHELDRKSDLLIATNFSTILLPRIPTIQVVYDLIYPLHTEWQPTLDDLRVRHGDNRIRTILSELLPIAKEFCTHFDGPWRQSGENLRDPSVGEIFKFVYSYYIHRACAFITMSKTIGDQLALYYPEAAGRVEVVYPAVQKYRREDRRILQFSTESVRLLYVANIEPRKNHTQLLDSLPVLQDTFRLKPELTLIGRAHYGSHLPSFKNRYSAASERFDLTLNFVKDSVALGNFYHCAEIFVFPSMAEGFGLPLIEAMYFNLPTVALRTSTTEEVCEKSVLYVDTLAPAELAEKISELKSSATLRAELTRAQLENIKRFDGTQISRRVSELAREVQTPR